MIKNQNLALLCSLSAVAFGAQSTMAATADRPNVIVIMADDMGYGDAGFTGAKDILTPNLDALAASGVVFTQGYSNHPYSGPSRAALMSGRYQHRFGFETNPAYDPANPHLGICVKEKLFPKRLQEAGYKTAGFGKWHLGAAAPFHPNKRGFDYFYGFLGGGHDYFTIDTRVPVGEAYKQPLIRNEKSANFDGYLTTALSRDAVKYVKENVKGDKPLFMYVAYNAPHQPLQAPKEDIARYSHIEDKKRRTYAAMVDVMDRGVGEIVTALKEAGEYENTLIFFLSDNGGPQPSAKSPQAGNGSSNFPFSGGKGFMYEGGIHVPFMACWPAKIKGGIRVDYPVQAIDISRTAVEVAGGDPVNGNEMEGVNLVPYVTGEKKGTPHDAIFWRSGKGAMAAVDSEGKKYLRHGQGKQFYDLRADIGEKNNLIEKEPKLAKELLAKWDKWNESNVPSRMFNYIEYIKRRDAFFKSAMPEDAQVND
ncbi:MAG: sulfatase-like hydrolase/transferase [Rikenellaceae bacterium]